MSRGISIRSEVELQGELAEAPFVVCTVVAADAALGGRDGYRHASANVGNVVQALLDKEVVMVEDIEALCPELQIDLLVNGEGSC